MLTAESSIEPQHIPTEVKTLKRDVEFVFSASRQILLRSKEKPRRTGPNERPAIQTARGGSTIASMSQSRIHLLISRQFEVLCC
jgi:hypothetical protein